MRRAGLLLAGAAIVALLALPAVLSSYAITVFIFIFFYGYLGQAWNVLGGYAGQLSAGHAAFVGVGGYATTLLSMHWGLSPWIGIDLLAPVFAPTVKSSPAVYSNFIDGTTSWEGVAPGNGTYTVRLVLLRSQAKQIGKVDYELDVDLK